jgi:hypothetical protein
MGNFFISAMPAIGGGASELLGKAGRVYLQGEYVVHCSLVAQTSDLR